MAWNDWSLVGGSLRVWRHYLPKAMIYGADIDKKCLFQEDRIKTYFIDQLTPKTFDNVLSKTGGDFDVIIDDGLHHLTANLNSLLFALRALRKNGVLIIEEIDFAYDRQNGDIYRLWQTIGRLLPKNYHYEIIKCNIFHVFIIQKQ